MWYEAARDVAPPTRRARGRAAVGPVLLGTVLAAIVILSGALTAVGVGTAYTWAGSATGAAAAAGSCEYWTTDEGVSAVVVTSGANCGTRAFKINAASYHGAVFSYVHGETAYNSFLTQIVEFVNGPGSAPAPFGGSEPSVSGLQMIGSADNAFTNHVPVYVFAGPGDVNDRAAEAMNALIHNTFEPQI
jgi:hypothetical protein